MIIIQPTPLGVTNFSRSSTATYVGSDGLIKNAAINEARPLYVDGDLQGVLIEEQRTNLRTYSEQFNDAAWTKTRSSIIANATTAPDGTSTADKLVEDTTANNTHRLVQTLSWVSETTYTTSIFAKLGGRKSFIFRADTTAFSANGNATFDLEAGTAAFATPFTNATIQSFGNGWYKCTATATANATATNPNMYIDLLDATGSRTYTGDGTSGIFLWGAQLEAGAFATSYIPTVASQVTRSADILTGNGLVYSNVPENDAPLWTAGTYTLGQQRIYDHRVYEVIVSTTTDRPDIGAVAIPPSWLDLGATNRYKMFDQIINTQTVYAGEIAVALTPAAIVNAAAFFGMLGNSITLTMTDPTDGVVYTETRSLQDNTLIIDWYPYFFEEIAYSPDTVFLNLPAYGSATLTAIIDGGAGDAKVGEVVIGKQRNLGVTNFGTSVSIIDYSVKSTDDFGNTIIVQRAYSKRADYDVTVNTSSVASVQKALADIRTTPTVFVGDSNRPETVVYGFYKQFNIVLSTPSISDCSIEVEGLV